MQKQRLLVLMAISLVFVHPACGSATPEPTTRSESAEATGLTDADWEYLADVVDISDQYLTWFQEFNDYVRVAVNDALHTQTPLKEAIGERGLEMLNEILVVNEEVRALDCPPRCETIHTDLLEAADHFENYVGLITESLEESRPDKLRQAHEEFILGKEAMERVEDGVSQLTH